ncbi:hypothetical protein [Streptomyces sp. NPDC002078]
MKLPRSTVVTAGIAAASALAATGITYASAASAPQSTPAPQSIPAAPDTAPFGGEAGQGKGNEGGNRGRGHEEWGPEDWGRIEINERSYSAHPGDCVTVISGLGAKTLNIRNDSRKTVEVFRGVVCDNGAPVATVGPRSSADGVRVGHIHGINIKDGVVASFRVVRHFDEDWD